MAKVNSIKPQPTCWFKYNPREHKLVIQCQPIKPYSKIDELKVDTFTRTNPGFKGDEDGRQPSV